MIGYFHDILVTCRFVRHHTHTHDDLYIGGLVARYNRYNVTELAISPEISYVATLHGNALLRGTAGPPTRLS